MALPVNVDSSGINLIEDFVGREDELTTLQTNLVDSAIWRGVIVSGPEGSGKTSLVVKFAEQAALSFDVIKLIPLKEASTAQAVLDWLGGCLQSYEKQLKSKQVTNFIQSKDEADDLAGKIAPLLKLLSLRKVLIIFDDYIPDEATEIPQLLSMLVDNVNKSSCFIVTHTTDFNLAVSDKTSQTIGHITMAPSIVKTEEIENEVNMAEENAVEPDIETPHEVEEPQEVETPQENEPPKETPETTAEDSDVSPTKADPTPPLNPETVDSTPPEEQKAESISEPEPIEPEIVEPTESTPQKESTLNPVPEPEPIEEGDQTAIQYLKAGQQLLSTSDDVEAKKSFEQAIAMFKAVNDKVGLANSVEALGVLCITQTNYSEAQTHLENALTLKQNLNDRSGVLELLSQLKLVSQLQGDTAQARVYSQQSETLLQETI